MRGKKEKKNNIKCENKKAEKLSTDFILPFFTPFKYRHSFTFSFDCYIVSIQRQLPVLFPRKIPLNLKNNQVITSVHLTCDRYSYVLSFYR